MDDALQSSTYQASFPQAPAPSLQGIRFPNLRWENWFFMGVPPQPQTHLVASSPAAPFPFWFHFLAITNRSQQFSQQAVLNNSS